MYTFSITDITDNGLYATGMLLAIHPGSRTGIDYMSTSHTNQRFDLQPGNCYRIATMALPTRLEKQKSYNLTGHWSGNQPPFEFTATKAQLLTDHVPENIAAL